MNQTSKRKMSQPSNNEHILRVGVVVSVKGRIIEVLVDKAKNASHLLYNGEILRNVSVGSYVKITKGFEQLIGKIESEFVTEDKAFAEKQYKHDKELIKRVLQLSLVGYFEGESFQQGIKELPLIDNECYILTKKEFNNVHYFLAEGDIGIEIGCLANETAKKIEIGINSLFASHIGIFGNTGSGKSYSLASLYHRLFERFGNEKGFQQNAKFLLIDFNGEYVSNKFGEDVITEMVNKVIVEVPTTKCKIQKSSLENIEILSILLDATEKTQKPFLKNVIDFKKFNMQGFDYKLFIKTEVITPLLNKKDKEYGTKAFTNFFNDLYECVENVDEIYNIKELISTELGHYTTGSYYSITIENHPEKSVGGNMFSAANINNYFVNPLYSLVDKLNFGAGNLTDMQIKLVLKYHLDLLNGHANQEHLSPLIKRVKTIFKKLNKLVDVVTKKEEGAIFEVISLKNEDDNSLKKALTLMLCKEAYDTHKKHYKEGKYLNIIIDEAHNVLSRSSIRESETWKDYRLETFEEIIKEGRKFGVFLTIASQRPSDISATIISQLHNYFLHRLINNKDIEAVERTVSYLDKVSFDGLPILPTGSCILAGLSAKLPIVLKMHALDEKYQPNSKTIKPTDFWITNDFPPNDSEQVTDTVPKKEEAEHVISNEDYADDDLPF
ncbi:ATP-binding protein [Sphingobacterium mizutaii]|uniref:ATP-binding protein n=1 Tax=Sphingobacterium mizutaii TaxID=1010 RepID=UPI0028A12CA6|nr:ATP-binding protein [Sphingobacterium mizutaii]